MNGGNPGHYFDENPLAPSREVSYDIDGPHGPLRVISDSGVFSHGGLDKATALLLQELSRCDVPPDGDILDLGCGAGPIAFFLAAAHPTRTVWAVDTNARAIDLCARGATLNGLTNVTAVPPTAVPDHVRFGVICSNPPIRVGKQELHRILSEWLRRLTPDGIALFVIGKHLGADSLQRWLTDEGWITERVGSSKGFRLLRTVARAAMD